MKGVIASIAPEARIVDLTHCVPRHDIRSAAFHLSGAVGYFPPGTVRTVVVDPGVGGTRRTIAVQTERAFYVAPDNGVLTLALRNDPQKTIVHLTNREYWLPNVSMTFHGRDIFAPVAAHLACNVPVSRLGRMIDDPATIPFPRAVWNADGPIEGHIQHIDRFGNCITNIPADILSTAESPVFEVGGHSIRDISMSYSSAEPGAVLALVGSAGYIEIAVREGNAARRLGINVDSSVVCRIASRGTPDSRSLSKNSLHHG